MHTFLFDQSILPSSFLLRERSSCQEKRAMPSMHTHRHHCARGCFWIAHTHVYEENIFLAVSLYIFNAEEHLDLATKKFLFRRLPLAKKFLGKEQQFLISRLLLCYGIWILSIFHSFHLRIRNNCNLAVIFTTGFRFCMRSSSSSAGGEREKGASFLMLLLLIQF